MNIKIKNKLVALTLAGAILSISSCEELPEVVINDTDIVEDIKTEEESPKEEIVTIEEETIDPDSIEYNSREIEVVVANTNTPIIDMDGVKVGTFATGRDFILVDDNDSDNYRIWYYDRIGLVDKDNCHIETRRVLDRQMIKKGYLPKEAYIYNNKELTGNPILLNELEFVEIYKELEDCYLVQTIDYNVGYISKNSVLILDGRVAVTDISNQEVRFYEDNDLTLVAPVVTGTKGTSRETDKGLTNIISEWGAGWITPDAYVECIAYFNYTYEGYHTAQWRTFDEFGGDTYLNNGSHGCVNMRTEDAKYLCMKLEVGDWCLIKE